MHSLRSLTKHSISTSDGRKAIIADWLFGDRSWTIKYAVVRLGFPIFGREVLVIRSQLEGVELHRRLVYARLTYDQLEKCPDAELQLPVSKQKETELHALHGLAGEWGTGGLTGVTLAAPGVVEQQLAVVDEQLNTMDPHLRSAAKVRRYSVVARGEEAGHVVDFIVDDMVWGIPYVVVRCGRRFFGKRVVLARDRIRSLVWESRLLNADIAIEEMLEGEDWIPATSSSRPKTSLHTL